MRSRAHAEVKPDWGGDTLGSASSPPDTTATHRSGSTNDLSWFVPVWLQGTVTPPGNFPPAAGEGRQAGAIQIVENPHRGMGFTTKTERFAPEIAAYRLFTP